jgi:hypothetical protein
LIRKTCVRIKCKEIVKINDVMTKTSRPFRKIDKELSTKRISAIGTRAQGAIGASLLSQGVYIIPIEWKGKKIMQQVQVFKNLAQPTILGIDAIHILGITYLIET